MADREKLRLKKYGNRRLYDTARSTYVTLNQVADIIKQGTDVEVVDAKTQEDVTAFILTQIVLEQARRKNALLPVELLHLIIRYGENLLQEFFQKYLEQTINGYLQFKRSMDEQFSKWIDMQLNYSDMAQKTFSGLTQLQNIFGRSRQTPGSKNDKD
ncbi:MAG TPA: polyhydroxyalkanoate synthesis regulator DNA-binding domain-containing protein [Deltaproteobacteria bacterium]|jgi:polyhydroxyalkanoate synthesis repressor PhaR|nr:transcriptional regulator [Deltaproteobacteria bacterium]HRR68363.1 polyhydroxyalkanoate synthesis regulator DNA-binding domain-containing protein [Desulfomonilia bacterium]HOD70369.1 polyhydroxyalkanoate synthesis regulator DNA-binding domain-containing protein [Deltaproteobacteria bacterium]HOE71939.1 polyhydroxyalkanoate synthesis regulator DNA-binding domain-containing protein [Deltaproteobacteria bacterium]HON62658.1 polyhydroxyalkanoate synthesis regulator DNA-binding domain-containing